MNLHMIARCVVPFAPILWQADISSFRIGALAAAQTCSTSSSITSCSFSSTPFILMFNLLSYCSSLSLSHKAFNDCCWIYCLWTDCSSSILVICLVRVFVIHDSMAVVMALISTGVSYLPRRLSSPLHLHLHVLGFCMCLWRFLSAFFAFFDFRRHISAY